MVKYPQKPLNSKELNLHRTLQSSSSGVIFTKWGKPDQTSSSSTGHAGFPKRITSAALPPLPFQRNSAMTTQTALKTEFTWWKQRQQLQKVLDVTASLLHSAASRESALGGYGAEPVGAVAELRRARSETNDVRTSLHRRVWGSGLQNSSQF